MTEVETLDCGCGADCGREKFKRVTFNDSTKTHDQNPNGPIGTQP